VYGFNTLTPPRDGWMSAVATVLTIALVFHRTFNVGPSRSADSSYQTSAGAAALHPETENPFRFLSISTPPKIARIWMKGVKSMNDKITFDSVIYGSLYSMIACSVPQRKNDPAPSGSH
jgi:hypothetical protein